MSLEICVEYGLQTMRGQPINARFQKRRQAAIQSEPRARHRHTRPPEIDCRPSKTQRAGNVSACGMLVLTVRGKSSPPRRKRCGTRQTQKSGGSLGRRNADSSTAFRLGDPEAARQEVWMDWYEWKVRALNRLFQEQGVTGQPGRITAETVRRGEQARRVKQWRTWRTGSKCVDRLEP